MRPYEAYQLVLQKQANAVEAVVPNVFANTWKGPAIGMAAGATLGGLAGSRLSGDPHSAAVPAGIAAGAVGGALIGGRAQQYLRFRHIRDNLLKNESYKALPESHRRAGFKAMMQHLEDTPLAEGQNFHGAIETIVPNLEFRQVR